MKKNISIVNLLRIIYVSFPFLALLSFIAILLDIYKYQGFFKKHFFVGSMDLLNILLCLGLIINIFLLKKGLKTVERIYGLLYKLNFIILPLSVVFYIYFNDLLIKKGVNYVFSKYHLQPQNIPPLIFFSAIILFTYLYKGIKDKQKN